jgi:hypothetical protein
MSYLQVDGVLDSIGSGLAKAGSAVEQGATAVSQIRSAMSPASKDSGGGYVPPQAASFPILPVVLIGGAGLIALLILRKKG